ncbi:MAG TPA: RNA polymerase sigma factor [Gammaproteobacteria bacterium]|nr:RNA polymerase sigma factor [Gammaproteobacteria bacterium]
MTEAGSLGTIEAETASEARVETEGSPRTAVGGAAAARFGAVYISSAIGPADARGRAEARERTASPENGTEHADFVTQLFERHRAALLRYLSGLLGSGGAHDAEDLLQEAYARLLDARHLDRSGGRARAYLFKVATNLAHDRFRRRPTSSLEDAPATELASLDGSPECIVDFAQGLEIVAGALLGLKPRCRQVFLLRAAEELSYEVIAERLGISKRTVEREMKHALDVCQRRLERSRT